jgi:hypothetical protein
MSITELPAVGRVASLTVRLVAGRSTWGRFDVWPSRYGFTHYRLIVLPPGSTATDRARLALWRAAPIIAIVAGTGLLALGDVAGVPAAGWVVGALAASVVVLGAALATRALRPLIRTRFGCVDDIDGRSAAALELREVERSAAVLQGADLALRDGGLTLPQHEVAWGAVWSALDRTRPGR